VCTSNESTCREFINLILPFHNHHRESSISHCSLKRLAQRAQLQRSKTQQPHSTSASCLHKAVMEIVFLDLRQPNKYLILYRERHTHTCARALQHISKQISSRMQLISMNMQRTLGDNAEAADVYFAMLIIDFPPPRICDVCEFRLSAAR